MRTQFTTIILFFSKIRRGWDLSEKVGEKRIERVVEELFRAFSALNEAYRACEEGKWDLFKENYWKFMQYLNAATQWEDLASVNALLGEAYFGKFVKELDLPSEVLTWLEENGLWDILKIEKHFINAYASLMDNIISVREFDHEKEGRFSRTPFWVEHIIWLEMLRPFDPRTWVNAWRIKRDEYSELMENKRRGKEVDEAKLARLREELKGYLLKASVLKPDDTYIKRMLAELYADEGNYEKAIEYYKSCLNLQKSSYVMEKLYKIYESQGNINDAIQTLEKAVEFSPYEFENYVRLTRLYIETGNIGKARELIEKLSNTSGVETPDPSLYARLRRYYKALANCYEMIGDLKKALEYLNRVENIIRTRIQEYSKDSQGRHTLEEWLTIVKKIEELSRKAKLEESRKSQTN
ncbi:MAG: tetratricopeptide repeat protein [Nitrososphaerota archaeon]